MRLEKPLLVLLLGLPGLGRAQGGPSGPPATRSISAATVLELTSRSLPREVVREPACLWTFAGEEGVLAMVRLSPAARPVLLRLERDEEAWRLTAVVGEDGFWKQKMFPAALGAALAPRDLTIVRLTTLRDTLASYFLDMNGYPHVTRIQALRDGGEAVSIGLEPGYVPPGTLPTTDGWGRELRYDPLGGPHRVKEGERVAVYASGYRITSAGEDGEVSTPDDLCLEDGQLRLDCGARGR